MYVCVCVFFLGGLWTKSRTLFIIYTYGQRGLLSRSCFSRGSTKNRYRSITTRCEIYIMLFWWYYILVLLLLLKRGVHCPWRLNFNSTNYNTVHTADWNVLQENIIMEFRTGYIICGQCTSKDSICFVRTKVSFFYLFIIFFSFTTVELGYVFSISIQTTPPPPTLNTVYRYISCSNPSWTHP